MGSSNGNRDIARQAIHSVQQVFRHRNRECGTRFRERRLPIRGSRLELRPFSWTRRALGPALMLIDRGLGISHRVQAIFGRSWAAPGHTARDRSRPGRLRLRSVLAGWVVRRHQLHQSRRRRDVDDHRKAPRFDRAERDRFEMQLLEIWSTRSDTRWNRSLRCSRAAASLCRRRR